MSPTAPRRFRGSASVIVVCLLTAGSASAAPPTSVDRSDADRRKEAQGLFEKAVRQSQAGDARGALGSFRQAYERSPSFRVLYNIGQLCQKTGDAACAVRAYEQYLKDGAEQVPAARRAAVETELGLLGKRVATLTVRSNATGADVSIDGDPAGKIPVERVVLNVGTHKVSVVRAEKSKDGTVTLTGGTSETLQLDLPEDPVVAPVVVLVPTPPPKASAPPPSAPPPEERPAPNRPRRVPIVPWAVTGVLAAGTAVSGVFAANAYGTYQDRRDQYPVSRSDLDGAQGSAKNLFLLTAALGGATVISAGVAAYFTWVAPPPRVGVNEPRTRVGFAIGPSGVAIVGVMP